VQTVDAPVASLTTVSTVPNGSVGLAHIPGAASEYHVASPSWSFATGAGTGAGGAVVVVVVARGGGGSVVVVVGGGGGSDVVVAGATVVVVVGAGAVVVAVAGA
jgi:hypothetical protein